MRMIFFVNISIDCASTIPNLANKCLPALAPTRTPPNILVKEVADIDAALTRGISDNVSPTHDVVVDTALAHTALQQPGAGVVPPLVELDSRKLLTQSSSDSLILSIYCRHSSNRARTLL